MTGKIQEHYDIVRRCYPTMSRIEIEREYGINRRRVSHLACKMGIRHTPETQLRISRQRQDNLMRHPPTKEQMMNGIRHREARRRIDEWRMAEGKPQLTHLRLRTMTVRAYKAKWNLISRHGYIADPDEPYTLFYDSRTRRAHHSHFDEDYFTERYHLTFREAEM